MVIVGTYEWNLQNLGRVWSTVSGQEAFSEGVPYHTVSVGTMSSGEAYWNLPRLGAWDLLGLPFNHSLLEASIQGRWERESFWRKSTLET